VCFFPTSELPWLSLHTQKIARYMCAHEAVKHLIDRYRWKEEDVYVQVGFSCIPQQHRGIQMLAISNLPLYASLVDQFMIAAPCFSI